MLQILIRLVLLWFLWGLIRAVIRAFSGTAEQGAGSWDQRTRTGGRGAGGFGDGFGGYRYRARGPSASRVRRRREALDTLGLPEGASADEVKRSYRDLARKYHPDRVARKAPELSDLASEKFRKVHEAYEYLMANGTGRAS